MAYDMIRKVGLTEHASANAIMMHFAQYLSEEDKDRLREIEMNWNFYDGLHWEGITDNDKPQITKNYCETFVNKFVAFELGKGFLINMKKEVEAIEGDNNPKRFIDNVWDDNDWLAKCTEIGQSKAITGDSWVQVHYEPKMLNGKRNPNFHDPFDIYDKGKISLFVIPTAIVFPEFAEGADKDKLVKLTIMYIVDEEKRKLFGGNGIRKNLIRHVWTNERFEVLENDTVKSSVPNKYGTIPFVQIKNIPVVGKTRGLSDLRSIIPINAEINMKTSDISEIIDYHSAPITIVFGARVGQLQRGANKIWGGLPHNAKVENLKLEGDLGAANAYLADLKESLHEIGNVPVGALGGELKISNTSGIALQIALQPLIERVTMKQSSTAVGISKINALILLIAEKEGLIKIPEGISRKDFFANDISFESALPKDELEELEKLQSEMGMGIESREGSMQRLGREDIQSTIAKADKDRKENPELYGIKIETGTGTAVAKKPIGDNKEGDKLKTVSGYTNGPEPK